MDVRNAGGEEELLHRSVQEEELLHQFKKLGTAPSFTPKGVGEVELEGCCLQKMH